MNYSGTFFVIKAKVNNAIGISKRIRFDSKLRHFDASAS